MAPPLCFFKHQLSWIAVLPPLLVFAAFLGSGFLSILFTSAVVLLLSTSLFKFSKQKQELVVDKSVTEEVLIRSTQEPESEAMTHKAAVQQEVTYNVRSPDSLSESEGLDQLTSEDSEVDWPFRDHVDQSPDCSDGSISDEESLIEIALPSGHYVGHNHIQEEEQKKQKAKFNLQQKVVPDFGSQSIFKQHNIMELLAAEFNDMNEEDNLIEIDISMGSIKYSRFEIEA